MSHRVARRLTVAAVAACTAMVGLFPLAASAHAVLESSSPAPSQALPTSPEVIRLDFSEAIESGFSRIQLFDSGENSISIGDILRDPSDASVITSSVPALDDGVYVVVWRVVSVDGHPVTGAFPFSVGLGATADGAELMNRVLTDDQTVGQMRWALSLARLLGFLGAVVLVGHLWLTWGAADKWSPKSVRVMKWSTTSLAVGSAGVLLLQGPFASGRSWSGVFDAVLLGEVVPTRLGMAALVRLALVVAWGCLVLTAPRAGSMLWRSTAVFASAVTVLSFSASGHPSAEENLAFPVTVDFFHLIAVSVWVGGIISLWILRRENSAGTLASRFSSHATWSMPLVVVTGTIQTFNLTGGVSNMFETGYGRLIVVKILIVMTAIVLGTRGRRALRTAGIDGITKTLRWETWMVIVVVALTSVLVGFSPNSRSGSSGGAFSVTLVQGGVLADFTVDPTEVGAVEVHALFSPPGGSLEPVRSMTLSMSLPGRDVPPIPVTMSSLGANHFAGVVQVPFAGSWTMEARVVPKENVTLLYATTVDIGD